MGGKDLPVLLHQRDDGDGHLEDALDERDLAIEMMLASGLQQPAASQRTDMRCGARRCGTVGEGQHAGDLDRRCRVLRHFRITSNG
jgi:hypothetical protein